MAHVKTTHGKLNKPQDLVNDKISPQKMFIDNIDELEAFITTRMGAMSAQVADITILKAIDTSDTTIFKNGCLINVVALGLYQFNRGISIAGDDNIVIQPTTGGGRWILMTGTSTGYSVDTGTANNYVLTLPGVTSYYIGMTVLFKAVNANTGACTINVNSLGTRSLIRPSSTAMVSGDIPSGTMIHAIYDGTNFQLTTLLDNMVHVSETQILTNKTFTAPKVSSGSSINDTNGNELIKFPTAVANAVNEVTISNAITGTVPSIYASGSDTNIGFDLRTKGTGLLRIMVNSVISAVFDAIASAVNYFTFKSNISGGAPTISATGSDTNIDVNIVPKGTGRIKENGNKIALASELSAIVATGTGTAITLTLATMTAYENYRMITFIASANNSGAATTININGLGAKSLYKPGGTVAPNIISGKAYTIWYNGTNFFLKASAEGNTTPNHVLAGDTYSTDSDTGVVGTMVNNGPAVEQIINLTTQNEVYSIPEGYQSGLRRIKSVLTGLVASVIKAGTTVGGILGTFTSDANATANKILTGSNAYVNGVKVDGNIPDKSGTWTAPLEIVPDGGIGRIYAKAPNGFFDGNSGGLNLDDPDFIPANIISGKNIFGIAGSALPRVMASGTVTSDSANTIYNYADGGGGSVGKYSITVSGLSFTPLIILAVYIESGYEYITIYNAFTNIGASKEFHTYIANNNFYSGGSPENFKADVGGYVVNGGFKMPVARTVKVYSWVAFG